MRIHELAPSPGSVRTRKRVGRGIASGTGKTSGRGHKGFKSRSGSSTSGFEGGQMPLYRRLPKRGFRALHPHRYAEVNIGRVNVAVETGKINPANTIDAEALLAAGVIRRIRDGVRLLGEGEIKTAIRFRVTGASRAAIEAVEKAGGNVEVIVPSIPGPTGVQERAGKSRQKRKEKSSTKKIEATEKDSEVDEANASAEGTQAEAVGKDSEAGAPENAPDGTDDVPQEKE